MGAPRRYGPRVNTAIRFDEEIHEGLVVAAAEREVSINWIVNRAVRDFLDRLIPVDEMIVTRDRTDET